MFTVTDFLKILERSHQQSGLTRLNFLRSDVFNLPQNEVNTEEAITLDSIELCKAIQNRCTWAMLNNREMSIQTYLLLCMSPFFIDRIEWVDSIRNMRWVSGARMFEGIILRDENDSYYSSHTVLRPDQWTAFIEALIIFAEGETVDTA